MKKIKAGYPGSMITQNHGEDDNKGYLVWEFDKKKLIDVKYTRLDNEYGFVTINVQNGKYTIPKDIPKFPRIRIIAEKTKLSTINEIKAKLIKICTPCEYMVQRTEADFEIETAEGITFENLNDPKTQYNLVAGYLNLKHPHLKLDEDVELQKDILNHITTYNQEIVIDESKPKNIILTLEEVTFSNIFAFGENNVIDLKGNNGIIGISGPNFSGKSSSIAVILFLLYGKSSKNNKNNYIMNNKKDTFQASITFYINNILYSITKTGRRNTNGSVSIAIDFTDETNKLNLNGDDPRQTEKNIRELIGTYEDAILTNFSVQGNDRVFIEKKNAEKQNTFSRYMDIEIFKSIHDIIKNLISNDLGALNLYKKIDHTAKKYELENSYEAKEIELVEKEKEFGLLKTIMKTTNTSRNKLLKEFNNDVEEIEIESENTLLQMNKNKLQNLDEELKERVQIIVDNAKESFGNYQKTLASKKKQLDEYEIKLDQNIKSRDSFDIEAIEKHEQHSAQLKTDLDKLSNDIDNLKLLMTGKARQVQILKTDDRFTKEAICKTCPLLVEAWKALDELKEHKKTDEELTQQKAELEEDYYNRKDLTNDKNIYKQLLDDIFTIQNNIPTLKDSISDLEKTKEKLKTSSVEEKQKLIIDRNKKEQLIKENIANVEHRINVFEKSKKIIEKNKEIQEKLDKVEETIKQQENEQLIFETQIKQIESDKTLLKNEVEKEEQLIIDIKELEDKISTQQLLLEAYDRKSIPFLLIEKRLQIIQSEVNEILNLITNFTINFMSDGKSIDILINRDNDSFVPIDSGSGMEQFVSALAIRLSLIKLSNLPRTDVLFIDEGFGTLDAENLTNMNKLFTFLRSKFKAVYAISHIETLSDFFDIILEVGKDEEGFSKI